ncbi:hypothetical protein CRE_18665 [Caenorhabditis remanei]|uniref:Uncharacterized protein n=1 Tax=Caenorhabditis remanei TaxID=31234 RepID=E3LKW1_CAERE|nr:hypothetical protein CRE_18665 [Caenorhabditis remanei]
MATARAKLRISKIVDESDVDEATLNTINQGLSLTRADGNSMVRSALLQNMLAAVMAMMVILCVVASPKFYILETQWKRRNKRRKGTWNLDDPSHVKG